MANNWVGAVAEKNGSNPTTDTYNAPMTDIDPDAQADIEIAKIEKFIEQTAAILKVEIAPGVRQLPFLQVYIWCCNVAALYPFTDPEDLYQAILDAAGIDGPN